MGYWGSIVVARPAVLLAHQDGVERFGYRHMWLRHLDDGWQMLETSDITEPSDVAQACAWLAEATGAPVLAAHISDSYCGVLCAVSPGGRPSVAHLADVENTCGVFRHLPVPSERPVEDVFDDLLGWAQAAGRVPEPARLRAAVGCRRGAAGPDPDRDADDIFFDLVRAVGLPRIGRTVPYAFDPEGEPFGVVNTGMGLAYAARARAAERAWYAAEGQTGELAEEWEAEAVALSADLWTAVYQPDPDVSALAGRALWVRAAHDAARAGRPAPERYIEGSTTITNPRFLLEHMYDLQVGGTLRLAGRSDRARAWADARATDP